MDLIDNIQALAARVEKQAEYIATEEATKMAFVAPFISALGYDVFNPTEVTPELVADIGTKKGEKVDYAIIVDGEPVVLFECKSVKTSLESHNSQLYRYFNAVKAARIGVLTNGSTYQFFSDLEAPNVMDGKPFLEFDLNAVTPDIVLELKRLTKSEFDLDGMLAAAVELKYLREVKSILSQEFNDPSDEFVKFVARRVHKGMVTQGVREQFEAIIKKAFKQILSERISARLKAAMEEEAKQALSAMEVSAPKAQEEEGDGIDTTAEEKEAYYIVRAICRRFVEGRRIVHRDTKSYFGILLDDNNRKPICRLHFNNPKRLFIGLFDENKSEKRIPLEDLSEIYNYAERIKATIDSYESK